MINRVFQVVGTTLEKFRWWQGSRIRNVFTILHFICSQSERRKLHKYNISHGFLLLDHAF